MNLKQILPGHAITLLERKSTKAILSDAFNNDIPKINALMSAYDIGVVTTIQEHFPLGNLERSTMVLIAGWLNVPGMPNVKAVKTGKAVSLRLAVPILNQKEPFEQADINDVEKCFTAIQELSDFAGVRAKASVFTAC